MNIILLSTARKGPVNLSIRRRTVLFALMLFFVALPLAAGTAGYYAAASLQRGQSGVDASSVIEPQDRVAVAMTEARSALDALTMKIGELQARLIRLDALGRRLVETSKLDKGEFDFDQPPAMGGPEDSSATESMDLPDFLRALDGLTRRIDDREQQLALVDSMLMTRTIGEQAVPDTWPTRAGGWISSNFGKRTDPFTGKLAFHAGVDFAGKEGSTVVAAAAGLVTWSGERYGYGTMVELDHGNGYVTRYAHNESNLVKVGDVVEKGQAIASMGSSGRSTGPHVHFELLQNGRQTDPAKLLRASR
jgi:murein DD-endopeptidase MepM/ murein hydrolase activator NlpD